MKNRELNFTGDRPILYIVASPIGNLNEVSPRVLDTLNDCDIIACEDTRVSAKLLAHFNIKKELISCREHNEEETSIKLIELIKEGKKIAYLSDAGYPCISDPGNRLIIDALNSDIKISVISGSNAAINALVGSGLSTDKFYFHGFLNPKHNVRVEELRCLFLRKETLIFYEAPHRIGDTLNDLYSVFGSRKACIARELTKKHEEFIRGNLEELKIIDPKTLKGEMVVVVEGNDDEQPINMNDEDIRKMVRNLTDIGVSAKDAIRQVSELLNIKKNYIYKIYHTN
ncbi:MAG: 16S rRNA (cytidine(1402)-2'-O)-methyltransferase [Bacilli bacterium]|jgi:16S rRNA (cytidine1402-2'-O)-methyltransferase